MKFIVNIIKKEWIQVVLVALSLFWLVGILTSDMRSIRHDARASYSNFHFSVNCIANGELPLWDPYTHAGQPYYFQSLKHTGGEWFIIFFGLLAKFCGISILLLYYVYLILNFLIFAYGNYFLARTLFRESWISLLVLSVTLFSNVFFLYLSQDGTIQTLEFVPWILAMMIRLRRGPLCNLNIVGSALLLVMTLTNMDIFFSLVYLFVFLLFVVFARLPKPQWHVKRWVILLSLFIVIGGVAKPLYLFMQQDLITPSLRAIRSDRILEQPRLHFDVPDINLNLGSSKDQTARAELVDIANFALPIHLLRGKPMKPDQGGDFSTNIKFNLRIDYFFFLGFLPVFFIIYGLIYNRHIWQTGFLISGVLSAWISLGPDFYLSRILLFIPIVKTTRVMENYALPAFYVSGIFLLAYGVEGVVRDKQLKILNRRFINVLIVNIVIIIALAIWMHLLFKPFILLFTELEVWKMIRVFRFSLPVVALIGIAFECEGKRRSLFLMIWSIIAVLLSINHNQVYGDWVYWKYFVVFVFVNIGILTYAYRSTELTTRHNIGLAAASISLVYNVHVTYHSGLYNWYFWLLAVVFLCVIKYVSSGWFKFPNKSAIIILCCAFALDNQTNGYLMTWWAPDPVELPSSSQPFRYSNVREETVVIEGTENLLIRTPMLFHQRTVYDKPEYDFYMTNYFWKVFTKLKPNVSRNVLGIDAPLLRFHSNINIKADTDFINTANIANNNLSTFNKLFIAPDQDYIATTPCEDSANINVEYYTNNDIKIKVNAPCQGYLYYSDNYFPGWQARIDNNDVKIQRAYLAFKAVPIPPGEHQVYFWFRPTGYLMTMLMFLFSTAIAGTLFIVLIFVDDKYSFRN